MFLHFLSVFKRIGVGVWEDFVSSWKLKLTKYDKEHEIWLFMAYFIGRGIWSPCGWKKLERGERRCHEILPRGERCFLRSPFQSRIKISHWKERPWIVLFWKNFFFLSTWDGHSTIVSEIKDQLDKNYQDSRIPAAIVTAVGGGGLALGKGNFNFAGLLRK